MKKESREYTRTPAQDAEKETEKKETATFSEGDVKYVSEKLLRTAPAATQHHEYDLVGIVITPDTPRRTA